MRHDVGERGRAAVVEVRLARLRELQTQGAQAVQHLIGRSHGESFGPARLPLSGAKPKDTNAVRLLTILRVDKNVQPCLFDEGVWTLHEPYCLAIIAHQDQALRQRFGMTHAGAAAETLCNTRLVPWRDVGPPAAFVADPPTQRSGLRVDRAHTHDDHCEHATDPGLYGGTSRPILTDRLKATCSKAHTGKGVSAKNRR